MGCECASSSSISTSGLTPALRFDASRDSRRPGPSGATDITRSGGSGGSLNGKPRTSGGGEPGASPGRRRRGCRSNGTTGVGARPAPKAVHLVVFPRRCRGAGAHRPARRCRHVLDGAAGDARSLRVARGPGPPVPVRLPLHGPAPRDRSALRRVRQPDHLSSSPASTRRQCSRPAPSSSCPRTWPAVSRAATALSDKVVVPNNFALPQFGDTVEAPLPAPEPGVLRRLHRQPQALPGLEDLVAAVRTLP